jgi:undecaprenyl-diphosphatase
VIVGRRAGGGVVRRARATRTRVVQGLDDRLERWVGPYRDRLHRVASVATLPGEGFGHPVIGAVITGALFFTRGGPLRRFALPLAAASVGAVCAHRAVKFVYHRPRPEVALLRNKTEAAYPSGHTTGATAVLATSGYMLVREGLLPAPLVVACVVIVALSTGASRVVLGWHWGSDVAGGWLAGIFVAGMSSAWYEALRVFS